MNARGKRRGASTLGARRLAERHAPAAIKFLLMLAASAFVAYGAAQRKQGAAEAAGSARLSAVEQSVESLKTTLVPRGELGAVIAAQDKRLDAIHADVRETRKTQTEILLRLSALK